MSVKNGWFGGKEVNNVVYDPEKITVKKMEKLLKGTGIYLDTITGAE